MKKIRVLLATVAFTAGAVLVAPLQANAAPYCGITWGSVAKIAGGATTAPLKNVRTGTQPCFDRFVVDISGKAKGFRVGYVTQLAQPGSGHVIPLRGAADLSVVLAAPAYTASGAPSYRPANRLELSNVSGYNTFRQVVFAGSFENSTTFGLGVRARLPFRAFVLDGPGAGSRLVVDVAHRW